MPSFRWHALSAAVLLPVLCIQTTLTACEVTTRTSFRETSNSASGPSICPFRSINYITQTLPQQCLTTSWAMKATNGTDSLSFVSTTPHFKAENATKARITPDASTASAFDSGVISSVANLGGTPSTTSGKAVEPTAGADSDGDAESPLDTANFLSFEEWKMQNLAKAGQSAEHLGSRAGNTGGEPRRRPGGINNALDSLGEDTEIEIDFGGFANAENTPRPISTTGSNNGDYQQADEGVSATRTTADDLSAGHRRSKDAGKTCKERSNYASFDCAATIMKTNPECKGSNSILVENKDSYMLNVCSAQNKFFIVELCDDILIDTVVLANFEFFSSMFRTFRISVSDRYPVKLDKWKELGTYDARNSRDVQAFLVENPLIWARYLRIEFLSHFGNEYYCPVSLLRVHGTTMMEEFNHDLKRSATDEEADIEVGDGIETASGIVTAEVLKERTQVSPPAEEASAQPTETEVTATTEAQSGSIQNVAPLPTTKQIAMPSYSAYGSSQALGVEKLPFVFDDPVGICRPEEKPVIIEHVQSALTQTTGTSSQAAQVPTGSTANSTLISTAIDSSHSATSQASSSTVIPQQNISNSNPLQNQPATPGPSNDTLRSPVKLQSSPTQAPNANPTTQESFFKSVHKRLQLLESNSTLSLQYIEEQSRILRDAFSKVEKRQLAKTTTFLENLNTTVLTELRDFRNQYDQIWQSTVLELSSQREQSQHEVFALSARLTLLADEIVFQKRMAIVQFVLILLCLGLAIFSRHGSTANYLELPPIVQNALNRSPSKRSRYISSPGFETPLASPSSTRPSSRYGLFRGLTHRRSPSDDSHLDAAPHHHDDDGAKSPDIEYSPPTPTSQGSSDGERNGAPPLGRESGGPEVLSDRSFDVEQSALLGQIKSGPATPGGQRDD